MDRPSGVTTIAILFFAAAAYLCALGAVMLAWPGAVSMSAGAPLLSGLELSGPYMFLLTSAVAALIGWGLRRMHKWARWVTILVCFAGFVMLIAGVGRIGNHRADGGGVVSVDGAGGGAVWECSDTAEERLT